ncbi:hypothetical protein HDV63DRAFT_288522 [Trichoderma sp. SZMC 28014]
MTAVANPPTFPQISRPPWGTINGNNQVNTEDVRGMFMTRKSLSRSNSSSSISSNASNTTVATNGSHSNATSLSSASDLSQWSNGSANRKRPQPKNPWPAGKEPDFSRLPQGRPNGMGPSHGAMQQAGQGQPQMGPQGMMRPMGPSEQPFPPGQPMLYLLSLNGTFERKTIAVPLAPESIRIGRQTNQKTVPTATNGFFDSKVLSRQHAEIFAERNGKIYIRDVKSSNGTFVNGTRLSQENRESEPHELQTADHLELGIDIVSEDQKTVVHHKVAAKVEHAGFLNTSNNVLDMNFGDLDPANNAMMIPAGAMQMRGRAGSNVSMGGNGRMMVNGGTVNGHMNGMAQQRSFFLTPIATDQILKRLSNEMRSAKLQAQDLSRTNQFINTLLSKEDLKDLEKSDAPEPTKQPQTMVNGNNLSFRADPKARFSDPPAPPPQQPLPEKPDVPSLKRGSLERPRLDSANSSPIRQENLNQIIQLTEALNMAKRDIDTQTARMRELEMMLQKEREARELAEELARRLEESANSQVNGVESHEEVEKAQESPQDGDSADDSKTVLPELEEVSQADKVAQETAVALQSRIDTMDEQMRELRMQMEQWRSRCESAEAERDSSRKTLEEMVIQLREEEAKRVAAEEKRRSRSRSLRRDQNGAAQKGAAPPTPETANPAVKQERSLTNSSQDSADVPNLSRANTITPQTSPRGPLQNQHLRAGIPYASMIGVVLIGMGLMAYINGWQPSSPQTVER